MERYLSTNNFARKILTFAEIKENFQRNISSPSQTFMTLFWVFCPPLKILKSWTVRAWGRCVFVCSRPAQLQAVQSSNSCPLSCLWNYRKWFGREQGEGWWWCSYYMLLTSHLSVTRSFLLQGHFRNGRHNMVVKCFPLPGPNGNWCWEMDQTWVRHGFWHIPLLCQIWPSHISTSRKTYTHLSLCTLTHPTISCTLPKTRRSYHKFCIPP